MEISKTHETKRVKYRGLDTSSYIGDGGKNMMILEYDIDLGLQSSILN